MSWATLKNKNFSRKFQQGVHFTFIFQCQLLQLSLHHNLLLCWAPTNRFQQKLYLHYVSFMQCYHNALEQFERFSMECFPNKILMGSLFTISFVLGNVLGILIKYLEILSCSMFVLLVTHSQKFNYIHTLRTAFLERNINLYGIEKWICNPINTCRPSVSHITVGNWSRYFY